MGALHDVPLNQVYDALKQHEDSDTVRWDSVYDEVRYFDDNNTYQGEFDVVALDRDENTAYVLEVKGLPNGVERPRLLDKARTQYEEAASYFSENEWDLTWRLLINGPEETDVYTADELIEL